MSRFREFSPEFQVQVVLELLTNAHTASELCRQHQIKDFLLYRWKQEFLERAPQVFAKGSTGQYSGGSVRLCLGANEKPVGLSDRVKTLARQDQRSRPGPRSTGNAPPCASGRQHRQSAVRADTPFREEHRHMTMTSRERVLAAINLREPDRVPIDIGGTTVTGVHVDEYVLLARYLGLDMEPPKVYDQFQMLARVDGLVLGWFHSDVIQVENLTYWFGLRNAGWKLWRTSVGNAVLMPGNFDPVLGDDGRLHLYEQGRSVAMMPPGGLYFDRDVPTGLSGEIKRMGPEAWKRSIALYQDDELRLLEKRARFLYENTTYSVHGGCLKGGLGSNGLFAGHPICDWLVILATDREYAYAILQATAERAVENLALYLQAVGRYIDTILISGTDFGTQQGELFSPAVFKELYVPNYKLINDYVHAHSNAKTMFHTCGSVWNIVEYLIEAGVDILNPVQTTAKRMEPTSLKERYGSRIAFWGGGVDTQDILPFGSPEEVRRQVRERMAIFAPGGGFVFAPVHNLQYGVPPGMSRP